jgi:predicted nucleotidyltransferase
MTYYNKQEELIDTIIKNNIIFEGYCGSILYGTDTPQSDKDTVGVYMLPKQVLYGMQNIEEIDHSTNKTSSKNTASDEDIKYYSIKKFFEIAIKNGPNAIEMLFTPGLTTKWSTDIWENIRNNKDLFVSQIVFKSMFGYAYSQKSLARTKRDRYLSIEKGVEYLKNISNQGFIKLDDNIINELTLKTSSYVNKSGRQREYLAGQPIEQILTSMEEELNRYGHRAKEAMSNQDIELRYDWKFASHSIRLLIQCIELAETGNIIFPLREADLIKDIKFGKYGVTEIEEMFTMLDNKFNFIKHKSFLQKTPDYHKINKLLIDITDNYLKETYG